MRTPPSTPSASPKNHPISRYVRDAVFLVLGAAAAWGISALRKPDQPALNPQRPAVAAKAAPSVASDQPNDGGRRIALFPVTVDSGECFSRDEAETLLKARDIKSRILARIKGELGEEEEWRVSEDEVLRRIESAMEDGCLRFKSIRDGKLELESPDARTGDIASCTIDLQLSDERQGRVISEKIEAAYGDLEALFEEGEINEAFQAFSTDPILAEARAHGVEQAPFVTEFVDEIERAKAELSQPLSPDQKRIKICQIILRLLAMFERGKSVEGGLEGYGEVADFLVEVVDLYSAMLAEMLGESGATIAEACMEELGEQPICTP